MCTTAIEILFPSEVHRFQDNSFVLVGFNYLSICISEDFLKIRGFIFIIFASKQTIYKLTVYKRKYPFNAIYVVGKQTGWI